MAAQRGKPESNKVVFWTKPVSGEAESIVPGVNDIGNLRPHVRGGRTKEVRAVMPVVQPKIENLNLKNPKTSPLVSSNASPRLQDTDVSTCASTAKDGVSLKDLCVEDKKRVASLIKELARLGEEKENAEKNLEEERKHYEEQILSLVNQQEQILKEFEAQNKLLEYQATILKQQQEQQKRNLQKHSSDKISQHAKTTMKFSQNNAASTTSSCKENVAQSDGEDVPLTIITKATEEGLLHTQRDKWPRHVYVNDTRDIGIEDCSTQVHASSSPPPELDSANLLLQRPFTTIIDKELANQRQLLEATTEHIKYLPLQFSGHNLPQRHESKKGRTDHQVIEKAPSPNQNTELFMQKIPHSDGRAMKVSPSQNHPFVTGTSQPPPRHPGNNVYYLGQGQPPPEHPGNNVYYLGQGNKHLSPEKNEIIARFMQSQSEHVRSQHVPHRARSHANEAALADHAQIERNVKVHHKVKRRKPPPPSYGPLHAPIMSSTQKSSEFGDNLSVNSTVLMEHHNRQQSVDGGYQWQYLNDRNNSSKIVDQDKKQSRLDKEAVVKSPLGAGKYSMAGIDNQFLNKYKQMSDIEQKSELLKQRILLLEEQAKLKKILTDQQDQLRVQNQATVTPAKQMKVKNEDKVTYEMSLQELEEELAKKEQELIRARKHLTRKRQENPQTELNPESGKPQQQITPTTKRNLDVHTNKFPNDSNTQTDSCDVFGQRSPRNDLVSRMELKITPLQDQDFRQEVSKIPNREVITRNINKASSETNKELSPTEEKYITGKDGDACTVYPNKKVKDIVKKLDYSLHSDTEDDGEIQPDDEQGNAPARHVQLVLAEHVRMSATSPNKKNTTQKADVNTSISFIHIPNVGEDFTSGQPRQSGTDITFGQLKQTTGSETNLQDKRQTPRTENEKVQSHSFSPVDDALSVLEILNTLSETAPVSRRKPQTLEEVHLRRSLNENSNQHRPSLRLDGDKSRNGNSASFGQDGLILNGSFSKGHPVLEDLNGEQLCTLSQPKSSLSLLQRDPALELFELKAARRNGCNVLKEKGAWHGPSSDDEMDEDIDVGGSVSSEDDRIINTLKNFSNVDIVRRKQRQESDVNNGDLDSFEQNGKVDTVQRSVCDLSGHVTENIVEHDLVPDDEEESLILEEVFFVQS